MNIFKMDAKQFRWLDLWKPLEGRKDAYAFA